MLFVPAQSAQGFTYDNWGANPSTTPGTSVTPGASGAEGSWTQVASGANIAQDVYGIHLKVSGGATSAAAKLHVLDIGVDPAGGTSYSAIITDLLCGESPSVALQGSKEFYFPFFIKAGSSVAVRISGSASTAGTVRVAVKFFGLRRAPEVFPVGTFSESFGVSGTSGTAFTPGNAADGSWVSLGTTVNPLWWWQLGWQLNDTSITNEYTYIELAYGDASNKHRIFRIIHVGVTSEAIGDLFLSNLLWHVAYKPVPAGTNIYVRGRCSDAPDSNYQAAAIGIGG